MATAGGGGGGGGNHRASPGPGQVRESEYTYNTLSSIANESDFSNPYHFYVTVLNYSQIKVNQKGADRYMCSYIVTDESLMNMKEQHAGGTATAAGGGGGGPAAAAPTRIGKPVVLNIFANSLVEIPMIRAVGDVMRIHRARVDSYQGTKTLTANCNKKLRSAYLTFHRRMDLVRGFPSPLAEATGTGHYHFGLDDKEWIVKQYGGEKYAWDPRTDAPRVKVLHAQGLKYLQIISQKEDDPKQKEKSVALRNLKDAVDNTSSRLSRQRSLAAIESQETFDNYSKPSINSVRDNCDIVGMVCSVEVCRDESGNEVVGNISLWDGTITEEFQNQPIPSNLRPVESLQMTIPVLKQAYSTIYPTSSSSNPNAPHLSDVKIDEFSLLVLQGLVNANAILNEVRKELRQKSLEHTLPSHMRQTTSIETASADMLSAMSQLLARNININKVRVGFAIGKSYEGVVERIKSLTPGTWIRLRNLSKFQPDKNIFQTETGILFDRSFKTRMENLQEMVECNFAYQMAQILPETHICVLPPFTFDVMSVLSGCYDVYERCIGALSGFIIGARDGRAPWSAGSTAIVTSSGGGVNYNNSSSSNNAMHISYGDNNALVSTRSKRDIDVTNSNSNSNSNYNPDPLVTPLCLVMVSPVPARYVTKARIVSFKPTNSNNFVEVINDTSDFLFSIVIADATDSAEVVVHGEAAAQFVGVSATEFASSAEVKAKVKDKITALVENKSLHKFHIQLYYSDISSLPTSNNSNNNNNSKKSSRVDKDSAGPLTLKSAMDRVYGYRNSGASVCISLFNSSIDLMNMVIAPPTSSSSSSATLISNAGNK